jgi:tRNA(Ile)-lysidine synthase
MVLLHLFLSIKEELELTLEVAHLDHGIRTEAKLDAKFVQEQVQGFSLPFHLGAIDVPKLAEDSKQSTEAAARQARYEFFEKISKQTGCNKTALGHHKNDQAETMLMNLIRGAGPPGLSGMRSKRGPYIRPLLNVSRAEIEQFALENEIVFREDESNLDERFTRNHIRHSIMPQLEVLNPNILEMLIRTQTHTRQLIDFALNESERVFNSLLVSNSEAEIIFDRKEFKKLDPALQTGVVRHAFNTLTGDAKGLDTRHFQTVLKHSEGSNHGQILEFPRGRRVYIEENHLRFFVEQDLEPIPPIEIDVPGKTLWSKWQFMATQTTPDHVEINDASLQNWLVRLDWNTIKPPLKVRIRQPGDRIQPLGLNGHKKIKDIFVDAKVPRYKRDQIPIVVDADGPIWVVGHCLSERVKLTSDTTNVLLLEAK